MTNKLKIKFDEIKHALNELYGCVQKLEFYAANNYDHIYDVCNELKRQIQLDREETLLTTEYSNNDLKLSSLNEQFEDMLNTIVAYEKEVIQKQNKTKREKLNSLIAEFKLFFEIFFNYWSNVSQASISLDKLDKVYNHIEKYSNVIDSFISDLIEVNFNNNLIAIKKTRKSSENHLKYRIVFKQVFKYTPSNRLNFSQLVDYFEDKFFIPELDNFKCDQFESGIYLVAAAIPCANKSMCVIFEPNKNRILREACFDNLLLVNFKIRKDLILFSFDTTDSTKSIVLTDLNFNLIKTIRIDAFFVQFDESYVFCYSYKRADNLGMVILLDWSLEFVDSLVLHSFDSSQPFYMPTFPFFSNIKSKYDRFYIQNSKNLFIFSRNGILINSIKTSEFSSFEFDSSDKLLILNEKRTILCHYDLNGNLIKEIDLIGLTDSVSQSKNYKLKFLIENSNNEIVFYRENNLTFYSK